MTTTTHHTGTERYLAYELVAAGEEAIPTTASDIYAVGCIGLEVCFPVTNRNRRFHQNNRSFFPNLLTRIGKIITVARYMLT